MAIITIEDVKRNARIEHPLEDDLIDMYAKSAEAITLEYIRRTEDELEDKWGCVPAPVKQACIMMATTWYDNRQPLGNIQMHSIPYTYEFLLKPYMKLAE